MAGPEERLHHQHLVKRSGKIAQKFDYAESVILTSLADWAGKVWKFWTLPGAPPPGTRGARRGFVRRLTSGTVKVYATTAWRVLQ